MQSKDPALEITSSEGDGPQPVSVVQQQMLRIEQELPGLPQFNLPFAFRLQGPLNVRALQRGMVGYRRKGLEDLLGHSGSEV